MILSEKVIQEKLGKEIIIDPFNKDQLTPNSYDLRLHNELLIYNEKILDMKKENKFFLLFKHQHLQYSFWGCLLHLEVISPI